MGQVLLDIPVSYHKTNLPEPHNVQLSCPLFRELVALTVQHVSRRFHWKR